MFIPTTELTGAYDVTALPGYEMAYVERGTNFTTTQTVQASADTIVTLPSITFNGSTAVYIQYFASNATHNAGGFAVMRVHFWEDSTDLGLVGLVTASSASHIQSFGIVGMRRTPTAGAKVYTARGWITGAGTGTVFGSSLMWMRVVRA